MKKLWIASTLILTLSACQSTSTQSGNMQTNETRRLVLEQRAMSGDADAQYKLAIEYFHTGKKDEGLGMLEKLADSHHEDAMNSLAKIQMNGSLGYFSDEALLKFYPFSKDESSYIKTSYESVKKIKKYYNLDPEFWSDWYKRALPFTGELPFNYPAEIPEQGPHILINDMLFKVRNKVDSQYIIKRFSLMAEHADKRCEGLGGVEACYSHAYRVLAGEQEFNANNEQQLEALARFLKDHIEENKQFLESNMPKRPLQTPSDKTGKFIEKALHSYNANKWQESLDILFEGYKTIPATNKFDLAFTERFIGNLLAAGENDSKEDAQAIVARLDKALVYLKKASDEDELNVNERVGTLKLIADIYLVRKVEYKGAIISYIDYIMQFENYKNILPMESLQKVRTSVSS